VQPSGRFGQRQGWAERKMSWAETVLGVDRTGHGEFWPAIAVCWEKAYQEEDSAEEGLERERGRERERERERK
jgi:hypothetical protein